MNRGAPNLFDKPILLGIWNDIALELQIPSFNWQLGELCPQLCRSQVSMQLVTMRATVQAQVLWPAIYLAWQWKVTIFKRYCKASSSLAKAIWNPVARTRSTINCHPARVCVASFQDRLRSTLFHGLWWVDGDHLQTKLLDATKPQTAPVVALTSTSSMAAKLEKPNGKIFRWLLEPIGVVWKNVGEAPSNSMFWT